MKKLILKSPGLLTAAVIIIGSIIGISSLLRLQKIYEHNDVLIKQAYLQRLELEQLKYLNEVKVADYRALIITGNQNYLDKYVLHDKEFEKTAQAMLSKEDDPEERETIQTLVSLDNEKEKDLSEINLLMQKGHSSEKVLKIFDEKLLPKRIEITGLFQKLADQVEQERRMAKIIRDTGTQKSLSTLLVIVGASFSLVGLIVIYLNRSIGELLKKETHLVENLQNANLKLSRFSQIASHDLKEPLRTIHCFTELIASNLTLSNDSEMKKHFEFVRNAAKRLETLVERLYDFAKLDSKKLEIETIDLQDVLKEVQENLDSRIRENHAVLKLQLPFCVKGDRVLLTQAFQNLVANSIKYRSQDFPIIELSQVDRGECVEIKVKDNGKGFSSSLNEKIFEPFYRVPQMGKVEGTGLGLSTCKEIINRHKGTIKAESTPGKGSCFFIQLPKAALI